jgi:hypothetical protein
MPIGMDTAYMNTRVAEGEHQRQRQALADDIGDRPAPLEAVAEIAVQHDFPPAQAPVLLVPGPVEAKHPAHVLHLPRVHRRAAIAAWR